MSDVHTGHVKYLLPDFVNSQLDQEDHVMVEVHLRGCPECRLEIVALKNAFSLLELHHPQGPPDHYYNNLVPRVRGRLGQAAVSWIRNPVWTRIGMPIVAAGIAVVLLFRLPQSSLAPSRDILDGLSATIELNELADVLAQQHDLLPLSLRATQEFDEAVASDEAVKQQIVEKLRASKSEKEYDYLSGIATDQLVGSLSEGDVEILLHRLGERIVL
jgi:hypothetical protein